MSEIYFFKQGCTYHLSKKKIERGRIKKTDMGPSGCIIFTLKECYCGINILNMTHF